MNHDVIIVGAGPAGLSLARLLALDHIHSLVIEKLSAEDIQQPTEDGRDIALTHLSQSIMEESGLWQLMPDAEIGRIDHARVINGISDYALEFDHKGTGKDALGFIVSNHVIRKAAIDSILDDSHVTLLTDSEVTGIKNSAGQAEVDLADGKHFTAPLVVAADSRFSATRRQMGIGADMRDFGKVVIVCRMSVAESHQHTAWECFHYGRTLAVLPLMQGQVSVVITANTNLANQLMGLDEMAFSKDVSKCFDHRLGSMKLVGERFPYPLVAVHADRFISRRFALLGDAAVGMHPVTAHGFNLGLRGAHALTRCIREGRLSDPDIGADAVLQRYQRQLRLATLPMYYGTNALVSLFNNDTLPAKVARDAVLRIANNLPPLKRLIVNQLTEIKSRSIPTQTSR